VNGNGPSEVTMLGRRRGRHIRPAALRGVGRGAARCQTRRTRCRRCAASSRERALLDPAHRMSGAVRETTMNKLHAMLIAGLGAASLSFSAIAADTMSKSDAKTMKNDADGQYKAAKKKAHDDYEAAKASCKSMEGDAQKACMKDAKATEEKAEADAKATHEKEEADIKAMKK
jgi:hypothetical protein